MDDAEILNRINGFSRWHYEFELSGHKTPIFQLDHINRHHQRRNYFFQPLLDLLGGSLAGKSILDLGCNAGFWSLAAIESGCDYVMGIDGRQMHIDQAEFVFDVKQINKSRYSFRCGNIFDLLGSGLGTFDVVFCLGLMYHISKPVTLLERISAVNNDLLVIDTTLSKMRESTFQILHESLDEPRNAIDYGLVLVPTKTAVLDLVRQFGYQVVTLKPNFSDYAGAIDYETGDRRAFICGRRTDLAPIVGYDEPSQDVKTVNVKLGHIDINVDIPRDGLIYAITSKAMRGLRLAGLVGGRKI